MVVSTKNAVATALMASGSGVEEVPRRAVKGVSKPEARVRVGTSRAIIANKSQRRGGIWENYTLFLALVFVGKTAYAT